MSEELKILGKIRARLSAKEKELDEEIRNKRK